MNLGKSQVPLGAFLAMGAIVIAIVYMLWQILSVSVVINDAGLFAELSRIAAAPNLVLYADLWDNKPPVLFFFITPFIFLFGNTSFAIQIAGICLILVFSLSIFFFLRCQNASRLSLIISMLLAFFYGTVIIYTRGVETTILMAGLGTLSFALAFVNKGRFHYLLFSGIFFVFGVFSKQPLALEFPAFLLVSYLYGAPNRLKSIFLFCLACAIGVCIFLVWAAVNNIVFLVGEYTIWGNVFYAGSYTPYWNYFFRESLPIMGPLLLLALLSLVSLWRDSEHQFVIGMSGWLLTAILGSIMGKALIISYFVQLMPPVIILIAMGADKLFSSKSRVFSLASLLVTVIVLVAPLSYILSFGSYIKEQHDIDSPVLEISAYLDLHSSESDCLWLWGYINNISYYSGRRSCTAVPYEAMVMNRDGFNIDRYRPQYLTDLYENLPKYHINVSPWSYFPMLERYFQRYAGDAITGLGYPMISMDFSSLQRTQFNFQNLFTMIAFDNFQDETVCAGQSLQYAMTWRVQESPDIYYQSFIQIRNSETHEMLVGLDIPPIESYPTQDWLFEGEIILGDMITLTLPSTAPEGNYYLATGFYNPETLERLKILDAAGQEIGTETTLVQLNLVTNCETQN